MPTYYDEDRTTESRSLPALYSPDRVQGMASGNKKKLIESMEETITFLKDVGGYTDKGIDSMKVTDVKAIKEKVAKNMTMGKFKKWVEKGTKPEPVVQKIGATVLNTITWPFRAVKDGFQSGSLDESTLSIIFGVITVVMVGLLVFRMLTAAA